MRSLKFHLLIVVLALTVAAPFAAAQCTPPGWQLIGGGGGWQYDHIANGQPTGSSCWTITGNASVVTTTDCGYTAQAFDMHYGARVSQEFTVPAGNTQTHWDLTYLLTMQDPNNDGWWNRLKATVYNVTTGQTIKSQTYWGDDPDISCTRQDLTFTGNFAGQTLRVTFADGSSYANTVIRVRSVAMLQY